MDIQHTVELNNLVISIFLFVGIAKMQYPLFVIYFIDQSLLRRVIGFIYTFEILFRQNLIKSI